MTVFKNTFYLSLLSSETLETTETGDKNRDVSERKERKRESLGKIKAKDVELFRKGPVHEFYRLKVLITF